MDVIFELSEHHRSPEKVIRQLAGGSSSVDGRQRADDAPGIWLTQRTEGDNKLAVVTLLNPSKRVQIWYSISSTSDRSLVLGVVSVLLAPVLAVVACFVLGAGWWSLALAPVAFVLGTSLLTWRMRSWERKRAPAAESLLRQVSAQIDELFGNDATKLEDWSQRNPVEERARSLRIEVEMMEKALSQAEACEQRGDLIGKHVKLQTVLTLIGNDIEPNSDLFRRAGRLLGADESDFPRADSPDEIEAAMIAQADVVLESRLDGGEKCAVKGSVTELNAGATRWTATDYQLEHGGSGISWHDRALICSADGIYERRDGGWHRVLPINEDGEELSVDGVAAVAPRVGPHYIVAADNGVYDMDVSTGKTRTIYSGDCFWSVGCADDGAIYAGGDAGLTIVDAEGSSTLEFEDDIFVVAAKGNDVFAANSNGFFQREEDEWREILPGLPGNAEARAMALLGGGRVVVATFEDGVYYYDDSTWTSCGPEGATQLHGIWASGHDDIVVVGAHGFAAEYDGVSWSRIPLKTDELLLGAAKQGDEYIISTESGLIELHRT